MIDWPTAAALVAVSAPLVAVPLTVVTFHLRTLREHQTSRQNELARRLEVLEGTVGGAQQTLVEMQRDYTTKEEWLRESMAARHQLEKLLAAVTRLETEIDVVRGWSRYIESRLHAAGAAATRDAPEEDVIHPHRAEQC